MCKSGFVRTRTGWFSDRIAVYLASGKPVVLRGRSLPQRFGSRIPLLARCLSRRYYNREATKSPMMAALTVTRTATLSITCGCPLTRTIHLWWRSVAQHLRNVCAITAGSWPIPRRLPAPSKRIKSSSPDPLPISVS